MAMNPPPIEWQDPRWAWWAKPEFACPILFRKLYSEGDEGWAAPEAIRDEAVHLVRIRNYHPLDAIWMVREGMDHVALRTCPRTGVGCRTYEGWLQGFPNAQLGTYGMAARRAARWRSMPR